jgi:hypothetical protein
MGFVVVRHGEFDGLAVGVGGLQGLGDCSHVVAFPARLWVMASFILRDFEPLLYIYFNSPSSS